MSPQTAKSCDNGSEGIQGTDKPPELTKKGKMMQMTNIRHAEGHITTDAHTQKGTSQQMHKRKEPWQERTILVKERHHREGDG